MGSSSKAQEDLDFELFDFNEIEFLDNANSFLDNEAAEDFSKEISPDDPIFAEASNMAKAPVDVGAGDDQPQLHQINADSNTTGYGNVSNNSSSPLQVDQLVPSPGRTHESFPHQLSSDTNLGQPRYSGFEGNASSVAPNNAHETTSPLFSPLILEPTHSFPLGLAEIFPEDEAFSIQPFQSEIGANSIQTNNVSLKKKPPEDQGYSAQPLQPEHGVNFVQASQVNGPIRLTEKLPQNGGYSTQPLQSEHGANSNQTNQDDGHIGMVEELLQNEAYATQSFHSEHEGNLVQTNQVNDRVGLIENTLQNEGYSSQLLQSHGINSVQTNQVNGDIGNSLQAELLGPQRVESANRGKTIMLDDQLPQNNGINNFNGNGQQLPYSNSFIQSSSGIGYLHGGSTQINQLAPTRLSFNENNFSRPLAPSGQQGTQFQATANSDPQRYNFVRPRPLAPLRPQPLNNPLQRLNQAPNMPNASASLLQQSMPRYFSHQHDQVALAATTYNPQAYSTTRLPEPSIPSRTPIRPHHPLNQLGVSDLQYRNSLQSRAPMLSSGEYTLEDLVEQRQYNRFDPFNPATNRFGTRSSSSVLQEALMHSGSYRLPAHQPASSQFPIMPGLRNSDHHYPQLTESSFLPRLQPQGFLNQTARSVATYPNPTSETSLSSTILNSLLQKETADISAPSQMETSLSGHRERGSSGRRGSHSRRRLESGEPSSSSPYKRFRRDSSLAQASTAQQENMNLPSMHNEAGTASNTGPRPIPNLVYDPKYEGIGLPIDPHLRLFATI
ncbi:hypothetical protein V6N13_059397 [Hibiscus sabdariffa]|uniref:Uncharacterized protein n=1 Tax=Hibiscus sabdariffa TaxID=183260 RepID=A0ABR2GEX1_9ROSI